MAAPAGCCGPDGLMIGVTVFGDSAGDAFIVPHRRGPRRLGVDSAAAVRTIADDEPARGSSTVSRGHCACAGGHRAGPRRHPDRVNAGRSHLSHEAKFYHPVTARDWHPRLEIVMSQHLPDCQAHRHVAPSTCDAFHQPAPSSGMFEATHLPRFRGSMQGLPEDPASLRRGGLHRTVGNHEATREGSGDRHCRTARQDCRLGTGTHDEGCSCSTGCSFGHRRPRPL